MPDVPASVARQSRKPCHIRDRESGVSLYDAVEVISRALQRQKGSESYICQATVRGEGTVTPLADGQVFGTLMLEWL